MRSFIIEKTNKRFQGEKVSDVAKKAAKYLFQNQKNNKKSIVFCIKETTKGSKNKSYKYKALLKNDSKINIKKYIGGIPNKELYKIGDIVTLYDEHEKAYITYNNTNSTDINFKYFLNYREGNHDMVYYSDNLKLEKDIKKNSYWIINNITKVNNIFNPYYKYQFKLKDTELYLNINNRSINIEKGSIPTINTDIYLSLTNKNNTYQTYFTIIKNDNSVDNDLLGSNYFNNIENRDKFLITVRHKIPSVNKLRLRETYMRI